MRANFCEAGQLDHGWQFHCLGILEVHQVALPLCNQALYSGTPEVRGMIFQNMDQSNLEPEKIYMSMREKVMAWVSNMLTAANVFVPVDMGQVGSYAGAEQQMKCFNCGG